MRYLSFIVFALFSGGLFAQNGTISPYSFIGLGDTEKAKTIEELMMGGIGVAYSDGVQIGFSNPASYAGMQLTTFSLGAVNKNLSLLDNGEKARGSVTGVSYLSFGIPLGPKGGMLIGLMPQSNVGYSLLSFSEQDGRPVSDLYRGTGATNRLFFGLGYEVFKGFSLGFEGQYVFGNIEHTVVNQRFDVQYATKYITDSNVHGFRIKLGTLYQKEFENTFLSFGANVSLSADARFDGDQYFFPVNLQRTDEAPEANSDPIPVEGDIAYPIGYDLGLGFGRRDHWYAEFNYNHNGAPVQKGPAFGSMSRLQYKSMNTYALGGFFIPKYNSINSFWERVTYRIGFHYEQSGLLLDGNQNGEFSEIEDFGMAFGLGIPLRKPGSKINIGFDFGRKGSSSGGLIEENYFNIRLGVNLLDKWFIKRKIN